MPDSSFYLGRWADDRQPVHYDPADLTTHAVVIGMTGSGKTGLLIALLEEAARQGIPAIIIDPKGDLANLLLHFPQLRGEDFAPWIDPEQARREKTTVAALGEATAARWRKGLSDWNLGPDALAELRDRVDYTIFTPGSTSGTPVNLLSSFAAPEHWDSEKEALRERIAATVTALLGLVGMNNIDPLRSREHILLANIFEQAWSQGESLDLAGLIEHVQSPPFDRLGAFPLDRFFPEKDRFALALLLNNFLAAPSFQPWLEGQPLEPENLLHTQAGKPRFSIFYLAHLSENERMFFVTLLLAAVESWMRAQRGTSGLRALLAFDEIVGYLPPVANPPSRAVLLRLLKQARAFGLGLALATQNPTDLNYKALSNAGTWFIGRLQTEQDKDRLLDGLQSLESAIDRGAFDQMIAALKPRLFLLHNVHQPGPRTFQSRWALNYLAGPLTRGQLGIGKKAEAAPRGPAEHSRSFASEAARSAAARPEARIVEAQSAAARTTEARSAAAQPAAARPAPSRPAASRPAAQASGGSGSTGAPDGIAQFFFPATLSLQGALAAHGGALRGPLDPQGLVYKPALLAQTTIRYINRRYGLDYSRQVTCLMPDPQVGIGQAVADWDAYTRPPIHPLPGSTPPAGARLLPLPPSLATARGLSSLQKDFIDWIYQTGTIYLRANELLKVYAGPGVSAEAFRRQIEDALRMGLQGDIDKIAARYDEKLQALSTKIERQQRVADRRQEAADQRQSELNATNLAMLTSVFTRRKPSRSTTNSKQRLTREAKNEFNEAKKALDALQAQWKALAGERSGAIERARAEWEERANQITQVPVPPMKKDIFVNQFGIAWLPYYQVNNPDGQIELPAY